MRYFDITTNEDEAPGRLLVKIPFEISTSFKEAFTGQWQWHHDQKAWSLPADCRSTLDVWIELSRGVATASRVATRLHMTEAEIQRVKDEAAAATAKIAQQNAERESLAALKITLIESRKTLKAQHDLIAATDAELSFERQQQAEHQAEIEATLAPLIDLPKLRQAFDIMTRLETATSRSDHEEWRAAQLETIIARNTLANAGLDLEAVTFLAECREPIRKMPPAAWFSLTKKR